MAKVKSSFIFSLGVALLPFSSVFCMNEESAGEKESRPHQESTYQARGENPPPEEARPKAPPKDPFSLHEKFQEADFENHPFLVDSYVPETREKSRPQEWGEAFFSSWMKTLKLLTEPYEETKKPDERLGEEQEKALNLDCKTVDGVSLGKILRRIREAKKSFVESEFLPQEEDSKEGNKDLQTAEDYLASELRIACDYVNKNEFQEGIEGLRNTENNLLEKMKELIEKKDEISSSKKDSEEESSLRSAEKIFEGTMDNLLSRVILGRRNAPEGFRKRGEKEGPPRVKNQEELEFLTQVAHPSICRAQPSPDESEKPTFQEGELSPEEREEIKSSHVKKYNKQIEENNAILSKDFRAHALTTACSVAGGGLGGAAADYFFSGYMLKKGENLEEAITPYLPQWIKESPALLKTTQTVTRNSLRVATDGVGFLVGAQLGHMAGAFLASTIWGA